MGVFSGIRGLFRDADDSPASIVESDSLRIVLPPKWKVRRDANPISARGPEGEILKVTSFSISGGGPSQELAEIRAELVMKLRRTIEQTASEEVFTGFSGITEEQMPSATLLFATLKSRKGEFSFWQYGLVGPRTGVYANCQFPPGATSTQAMLAAVKAVEWK